MVYYAGLTRAYATVLAHIDPRQVPLESLFLALNGMTLGAWFLLVCFPRKRLTRLVSLIAVWTLALFYSAIFLVAFHENLVQHDIFSLNAVKELFRTEFMTFFAWTHMLCFNLIIGRIMAADAIAFALPQVVLIPPLLLTMFAGPIGYIAYYVLRYVYRGHCSSRLLD